LTGKLLTPWAQEKPDKKLQYPNNCVGAVIPKLPKNYRKPIIF